MIVPIVYPALERNARLHWNQSVLNVTMNVRKMFFDMDERLLLTCQSNFQADEEKRAAAEEHRRLTWEQLERNADPAFRPANAPPSSAPPRVPTVT